MRSLRLIRQRIWLCLATFSYSLVGHTTIQSDFETASGIKITAIGGMMTHMMYVLMCIFGGWVMVHTVKKLIDADGTDYYEIIGLVFRAMLILIVIILTLT